MYLKIIFAALLLVAGTVTSRPVSVAAGPMNFDQTRAATDSIGHLLDDEAKAAGAFDPNGGIEAYLHRARLHNPGLRAAYHNLEAALARTGYAGALPDPMFMYAYQFESIETRVGPQEQRFGIRQSFPWFGTLGARKDEARSATQAAYRAFEAEQLDLEYEVRSAFYDYYYLGRDIGITRENLELLGFWEQVARTKYRVALQSHPDLIKVQVELGKLEDRLLRLEQMREPIAARLRSLLSLATDIDLPVPDSITAHLSSLDSNLVMSRVRQHNPDLGRLTATVEADRAGRRAAARSTLPDFQVGIDYVATGMATNPALPESGKDAWMATASVSLPIWFGKNRSIRREADARLRQSEQRLSETRNRLDEMTAMVLFERADALRRVRLYRDGLIPKAEQVLNATYTAYQAGKSDFLSLLDAQRELLEFRLQFERSLVDLATRDAELAMLAGDQTGRGLTANAAGTTP